MSVHSGSVMRSIGLGRRPARRRGSRPAGVPIRGLLPVVVALVVWQLLGSSQPYFPAPNEWYQAVSGLSSSGELWPAVGATLYSFILSLAIAAAVGVVLGYLVGRSRLYDRMLNPFLEFIRFTPASAILPLAVIFIGYDQRMTVLVVVLGAVWPILLQTRAGMRAIDSSVFDVADSLRMPPAARLRKITIPAILPDILLGVRIAMPTVLILVLLVELTTNVSGLGQLLSKAQTNFETSAVYGLVILSSLVGLAASALLSIVESYLLRYRPEA